MFPAFYIFGKQIGMYGVCAVLGFLVSGFVGSKLARRRGISTEDLILVTLSAAIGLFIGGHILFGLTNFDKLIKLFGMIGSISFGSFLYCLGVIFGGSVFYGGLLGGYPRQPDRHRVLCAGNTAYDSVQVPCERVCLRQVQPDCAQQLPQGAYCNDDRYSS